MGNAELAVVAVAADSGLSEELSMKEVPKEVKSEEGSTVVLSKVAAEELTAVKPSKAVLPEGGSMMVVPQEADSTTREAVEVVKANLVAEEDSMTIVPVVAEAAEVVEEATEVAEAAEEMPSHSTSSSKAIGPRLAILRSVS